ncbi:SNF2 family N-terminal domain containing protein [Tritrichomonas foetus]|uniref:SNF2 family N-terminal domain containing protein n=1 Tax=Tritrichomonas foetus TaxID=1144522 RepID=A0A1J4JNT6_9EUKA|nr:SNF2 family N-terminal domain containing protein [Tritrichomonas foetus]|eukprot:OHT00807.1 SNF2 family N-terminal domain containing protein [Tritrichomonas foetus]
MSATGPISGRRRTKAPVYYGSDSGSSESEEESDSDHHQIINENSDYEEEEEDAGPQIQQILGVKEDENQESETYYVKWSNLSYIHCTWLSLDEILSTPGGDVALRKFKKKTNDDELSRSNSIPSLLTASQDDLNLNWFHVERIIGKKDGKFFVKWKSLPYDQCTWEDPEDIPDKTVIDAYVKRSMHHNPTTIDKSIRSKELAKNKNASKRSDFNENKNSGDNSDEKDNSNAFEPLTEPLKDKSGNTLRPYQLEGLNWLRYCWHNHINSILADEMGLGKTVQIVSVLNDIATNAHITGPFLIIAPLTTLPQWKNEFERWTILNAIIYHGSPTTREIIEEYEFPAYDENGQEIPNAVSFDALITNYETFVTNFQKLKEIEWRYLVLDEGHRLKNHSGKCYQLLLQLTYEHCTLLTGTPIQNNVEELWSLLHLLHPSVFNDLPEFLERFGNIDNVETLRSLQELIRPFLLRRKKNDVETSIAAKEETIIEVELTRIQKTYYRAFLHESASTLLQQITGGSLPSLLNLMMQLRKVCNHPFLIKGAREDIEEQIKQKMPEETDIEDIELKALIDASGKMILIDKLLPKLQNDGHKVLIFSQMVKVLDIIEDYLIRKDLTFERIDGSVPESERESAIERFGKQPDIFIFLLCTKAGGVGINLTAADTVIIFDSDWNPQNDVQAQSRCHRIGQKREVKVYRLVTRGTYELQMLDRASKKLGLDHALLDGGELNHSQPMAAKEIEKLLRHGAYDITHDDDTEIDNFCSADIDQILERRSKKLTSEDSSTSLFNKAKFDPEKDSLDLNASDFWAHVLPSVSFAKDEPLARRRCRRDTPNVIDHDSSSDSETPIPEKTNRKKISPVSIRGTIRRLLNFGLGDCQYQRAILHQAAFMSNLSPVEEQYIKNLLNIDDIQNPPEEIVNALAEFSSNLNDVRERKTSIVRRCILFYRLKPLIKKLQGQVNIWPPSDSIDPMLDYALLLGISENGIGEGSNTFEGLSNEEPRLISLKSLEKKLFGLIDALEQELGPLNPEEEDVEIKGPQEWKEAHPNLYNRAYLNNEELQSLFQTIANFGLPRKSFDLSLEFYYPYESNGILDDFTYHHNGKRNINSTSNISNNVSNSVSNNVSDNVSDNEKDKHNEEQSNEQNYNEENNNKENCDDKNNEQNFNEENHNEENHNEEKNNEEKNNEEKNNEEKNNEENNNEENNNEENHNEENHNKQNHNEENNNDQNHNEENNNEENNHEQNNNEENNYNINNNNKIDIHENNEENNCQINDHNVNYNINDDKTN